MTRSDRDFGDPGAILADLWTRRALESGEVALVLVRDPWGDHDIIDVRMLRPSRWRDLEEHDLSELLRREAQRMPIPEWDRKAPRHAIVTVVARPGFAVIGPRDGRWMSAWLYSNHLTDAVSGDVVVVTEHGWVDAMTQRGGHSPRLAAASGGSEGG